MGIGDLIAFVQNKLDFLAVQLDPLGDLLLVLAHFIEGHQHKIPGLDTLQILQPFHEHIGQAVILHDHIPVVADGDGRGNHPGRVNVLLLHAVAACGNAGQRLTAALLPLEKAIPLLKHPVDVLPLQVVEPDRFLILCVPQGEVFKPCCNLRVIRHITEVLTLILILPTLSAQKPLKAFEVLRAVLQHSIINLCGTKCTVPHHLSGSGAVAFIGQGVVVFHQGDHIPFRLHHLLSERAAQIGQNLGLSELLLLPCLIGHIRWLCLRIEPMQILTAFGVLILQQRVHLDLIQHLLRLVEEVFGGFFASGQFQQHMGLVLLQICFGEHQHLFVKGLCFCLNIVVAGQGI